MRCLKSPSIFALKSTVAATFLAYLAFAGPNTFGGGELIIRYRLDANSGAISRGMAKARLRLHEYIQTGPMARAGRLGLVRASTELDPDTAVQILRADPAIEHVERNSKIHAQFASNDPFFLNAKQWGVYGGLSSPANVYGSGAAQAWAAGYVGDNSVYVAVIDDGIQITHPDLAANIWTNPFDTIDSTDNDGNGYVDDLHGWNFIGNNNTVFQSGDTHATFLAGIIGGIGGNGQGVAGVNWNVTMISLRVLDGSGNGDVLNGVKAIDYCIDLKQRHGLRLVAINASWGGTEPSQELQEAVIRAAKAGILFVAVAGNGIPGSNNDVTPFYPGSLDTTQGTPNETAADYDGVITAASIDDVGNLSPFSNYGATSVHLGAPGQDITSTFPSSTYATNGSGTSLSAAHVTGAVALYASTHPNASAQQIRAAILGAAVPTPSLTGKTTTGGRLDISKIIVPATIEGRHIFYNNSAWDGNNAAANANDDAAIASDKTALLPGSKATFANYTSYSRGINGIMVDIQNPDNAGAISASDFSFTVGNNNTPSGWTAAPGPTSVTVRSGAGLNGSDRVTLIWADNAVQKKWMQVTVLSTSNTGLAIPDIFYFGNAIGETGNNAAGTPPDARVNLIDEIGARNNSTFSAALTSHYDFNRDKRVNLLDEIIARNNVAIGPVELKLIQL